MGRERYPCGVVFDAFVQSHALRRAEAEREHERVPRAALEPARDAAYAGTQLRLRLVLLFGPLALGTFGEGSDFDLGELRAAQAALVADVGASGPFLEALAR
ncbi:MAG: hypothetical protein ACRELB_14195 [Polyangiaceae bacterium]